jgi:eukaryotic-like serine/threonine-protein kinase
MDPPLSSAPAEPVTSGAATGRVIAHRFTVGALLGKGGRGEVYQAVQIDLEREVALKLLPDVADEDARLRFLEEARVAAAIRHPSVAEVFEAGVDDDGTAYYAMELLAGETLAARIEREGRLGPEVVVRIAAGVCSALGAVHQKGLVHRDVKPSNIFLARRPDGGVDPKLVDFGVAKRVAVEPETLTRATRRHLEQRKMPVPTATNIIVGTPRYLSPEQILGRPIDVRVDVWALAATLHEALGGAPAFSGATIGKLLEAIVTEPPSPLGPAGVPPALEKVLARGLAKKPEERFATIADFSTALWTALAETRRPEVASPVPALPVARYDRWLLGAAGALLLGVLGVMLARSGRPAPLLPGPPAAAVAMASAAPPTAAPLVTPGESAVAAATAAAVSVSPSRTRGARSPAPRDALPSPSTAAPAVAPAASGNFRVDDLKTPSF